MTHKTDAAQECSKLVLTFDICGSTVIVEDLARSDNLSVLQGLFVDLRDWLKETLPSYQGEVCNFTGDGWILLFPPTIAGASLIEFICGLLLRYIQLMDEDVVPKMEHKPRPVGMSFGAAKGRVVRLKMFERTEYVGRPINLACRLQGAIKTLVTEAGKTSAHKLCVPRDIYETMLKDFLTNWPQIVWAPTR